MELHKPRRRNGDAHMYCGPAALCAISGATYEDVRSFVNVEVRNRKENQGICGMHNFEMEKALWHLGYVADKLSCYSMYTDMKGNKQLTLNQFLKNRKEHERNCIMLILVTGHYLTVMGDKMVDNHTKSPINIALAPWKRKRMQGAWFIRPRTDDDF